MIVTQLVQLSSNRYKVYIDQEFAFVLYKGELHIYHIEEGQNIEKKDYDEIIHKLLPKRAKLRAMNLLQKKRYTEKQLTDKLKEGYYPEEITAEAIAYVKSFHYVDDLQFAVDYITYHEDTKSCRMITGDLLQKGISGEVIKQAFEEWQSQGGMQDEMEMIRQWLEKKHYSQEWDEKEKYRMYAFLLRKGFSVDNVNKAIHMNEI